MSHAYLPAARWWSAGAAGVAGLAARRRPTRRGLGGEDRGPDGVIP